MIAPPTREVGTRSAPSKASASLRSFGQAQRIVMLLNLITGLSLWAAAGLTEAPIADPADYGRLISAIHAEYWAIPLSLGAALHLLGQVVNGDRRLAPWVTPTWRLIGSIICLAVLATFVAGGLMAPLKLFTLVHFVQSAAFTGLCVWFTKLAVSDLKAGISMVAEKK